MSCRLRKYMSMRNNQPAIPEVLKTRLLMAGCLIVCVLVAGIFMEYQMGDGFLKLSCLCSICLGICFLYLLRIIFHRKYEMIEGEVVRIQKHRERKKSWEVIVRHESGQEKQFLISSLYHIRKGKSYWFYWKENELLGIEEKTF